ncbi:hypothetical protein [Calothrix sp. NIES-2098]|uniref:hypothetical protein n=1 Tax=Calothrix sp. NIES-2098 TaxID=1954171 RepID=UPI000B5E84AA|nr:hypothetical protein NIES2098_10890 [Calothrix sp. NIES-2098]
MIISDLSYMEAIEATVVGGFGWGEPSYGGDFEVEKDVNIDVNIDEDLNIDKDVTVTVDITGNLATAEASATAYGNNTIAEAFGFTYTDDNSSVANAFSVSGTY